MKAMLLLVFFLFLVIGHRLVEPLLGKKLYWALAVRIFLLFSIIVVFYLFFLTVAETSTKALTYSMTIVSLLIMLFLRAKDYLREKKKKNEE